jgi:hypothetical protein
MPEINLGPTGHTDNIHNEAMGVPVGQETAAPTPSQEGGTGDAPGISLPETVQAGAGTEATTAASAVPENPSASQEQVSSSDIDKVLSAIGEKIQNLPPESQEMIINGLENFAGKLGELPENQPTEPSSEQTPGSSSL